MEKINLKKPNILRLLLVIIVFVSAIYIRITYFQQTGKDIYAYEKAISDLFAGINPYKWTIESYSNPDDPGNHGYAYLPAIMYLNGFLYLIHLLSGISREVLWKIPVLLCDIGVGVILVKKLFKKDYWILMFGLLIWFFNPYFLLRSNYVFWDPIPVFIMLLSLEFLEKDSVLSGAFYALSVAFKTFPVILFPVFLIKSKNKLKFLTAGALVALLISLPFLTSIQDFLYYIKGSLFVHGDRFIQGRPFLFYISYYYKVELFQIIPFQVYSYLSMLGSFLIIPILYFFLKIRDKYVLSLAAFLNFYLFTPVLNRTYTIWFLPVLILGIYHLVKHKMFLYYLILSGYFVFYSWYLSQWKDGFHIWRP